MAVVRTETLQTDGDEPQTVDPHKENVEFAQHFLRRLTGDLIGNQENYRNMESVLLAHLALDDAGRFDAETTARNLFSGLNGIIKNGPMAAGVDTALVKMFEECVVEREYQEGGVTKTAIDYAVTAKNIEAYKIKNPSNGQDQSVAVFLATMNPSGHNDFNAGYLRDEYQSLAEMLNMFVPGLGSMLLGAMVTDPQVAEPSVLDVNVNFASAFALMQSASGREWEEFMSDEPAPPYSAVGYSSWQAPSGDHGLITDFFQGTGPYAFPLFTREGGIDVVPNFDTLLMRMIEVGYIKGVPADKRDPEYIALKAHAAAVSKGFDVDGGEAETIIAEMLRQGVLNTPMVAAERAELKTHLENQSLFQTQIQSPDRLAETLYANLKTLAPGSLNPAIGGEAIGKLEQIVSPYTKARTPEEFQERMEAYVNRTPGMEMGVGYEAPHAGNIVPAAGGGAVPSVPSVPSSPPIAPYVEPEAVPQLVAKGALAEGFNYSHPVEIGADDGDIFKDKGDVYKIGKGGSLNVLKSDADINDFVELLKDDTPTLEAILGDDNKPLAYFVSNDAGEGFYVTMTELDAPELGKVSGLEKLSEPVLPPPPPPAAAPSASSPPPPASSAPTPGG